MAKTLEIVRHVDDFTDVYFNRNTGIAFVYDAKNKKRFCCHESIDVTESIREKKKSGEWGKDDRCIRSNGRIYNIDTFVNNDFNDMVSANYCVCGACCERKMSEECDD